MLGAAAAGVAAPAWGADGDAAVLEAVGPIESSGFHPGAALAALARLQASGDPEATLRRYLSAQPHPPTGLFLVVRALVDEPFVATGDAAFPSVLRDGWLRPPALGAPTVVPPDDPTTHPRWPLWLVGDVPLSAVDGYQLGGLPESLVMHLDGLVGCRWRTRPFSPLAPAALAEALALTGPPRDVGVEHGLRAQLARYAAGR